MRNYDVVIIGGGLLGCFAARELCRFKLNTVLIEAREDVCTGISRANTAIVYSGYDTAPNTLKTEMCLRANGSFDALCGELGVRFVRCGSLMISLGQRGDNVLRKKYEQGLINGVEGLQLLSGEEVRALEPALSDKVTMGLLSPTTGTVNPWELGIAAYENAVENGADFRFGERVLAIEPTSEGYCVKTDKGSFFARFIINCGGLFSDSIREMCHTPLVRIFPKRGDYLIFDKSEGGILSHVIFHEPEQKGKGLTAVPTVDGNLLIGPSELPFEGESDFSTTEEGIEILLSLCDEILPSLDKSKLIRSFGTLRPNPFYVEKSADGSCTRDKKGISSFTILSDGEGSFLSFIGIKTPGLTCSRELGEYAAKTAAAYLSAKENPDFKPLRTPPLSLAHASAEERIAAAAENPLYGRIVCRCAGISEGEIVDAIHRGAATLDAVKRRAGTGMGRCQGGFCSTRIMEILARELNKTLSEIMKDGPGSFMTGGGRDERI